MLGFSVHSNFLKAILSIAIIFLLKAEVLSQEKITINIFKDTVAYHRGPIFLYQDSIALFSDMDDKKSYSFNIQGSESRLSEITFHQSIEMSQLGSWYYLFRNENRYYLLTSDYLFQFDTLGRLFNKTPVHFRENGITYFVDFTQPGFKVKVVNGALVCPIGFIKGKRQKENLLKYSKANTFMQLILHNGHKHLFGKYNNLYSKGYFPQIPCNKFLVIGNSVYTLNPFDEMLSMWELNSNSINSSWSMKLNFEVNLPEIDSNIRDASSQQILTHQLIESDNFLDFSINDSNLYLFVAPKINDTCEFGVVVNKPKESCYFPSLQERNQWIQYYGKPVYLFTFGLDGNLLKEQSIALPNESEILNQRGRELIFYRSASIRGNPMIYKLRLKAEK